MKATGHQHKPADSLSVYRTKRNFTKTAEPKGKTGRAGGNRYLIQKHDARRLHYDLRLEMDGVLKSWAVTRGPSIDPGDKRLAVQVEDHPLEYGDFEGTIPAGEYGGGTVMLWDSGTWESLGDAHRMLRDGRLTFRLRGKKLKGEWHLVRMRGSPREKRANWLLIKSRDDAARPGSGDMVVTQQDRSVKTGMTLKQIESDKKGKQWSSKKRAAEKSVETCPVPKRKAMPRRKTGTTKLGRAASMPDFIPLQLATRVAEPPDGSKWIHEIKFDGYRAEARLDGGKVKILTRSGLDWTARFPSIAKAVAALPANRVLIDGEIIALDRGNSPRFALLQQALSEGRDDGLIYMVFDLLHLDGRDVSKLALRDRKELLAELVRTADPSIRYSDHFGGDAQKIYRHACRMALEGVVSKMADDPYRSGRGRSWVKSKCRERQEFVIGGYTDPQGSRQGLGALLLGYWQSGRFVYAGRVGTGFGDEAGRKLRKKLDAIATARSPFVETPGLARRGVHFVTPKLVAEVEFATWTADGLVRQASFIALRDDKPPKAIGRERVRKAAEVTVKQSSGEQQVGGVRLTHPDRILYPKLKLTKADLAEYYLGVAELLLPYVADRPLSIVRCPDGQNGACFYQKHLTAGMPKAIKPIRLRESGASKQYVSVGDATGLVALVQFGVLELHPWGCAPGKIESADRIIFDLDPDPAVPWPKVVAAAKLVRDRLSSVNLQSFVKTTGGKGLHVAVPLSPPMPWAAVKSFSQAFAAQMAVDAPDDFVAKSSKAARRGKIFIDYLRNQRGATAVAPYSTRATPGATVSVPLDWKELTGSLRSDAFDAANVPAKLKRRRRDPWKEFFTLRQTIDRRLFG
ncbi:MAG: DNA ligase D [Dongiaceae bacterium]